jgi:hypothetical protein
MRVNLITRCSGQRTQGVESFPLSLTIRPACGLPGDYVYPTDSASLLKMLDQRTDLPTTVLRRFHGDMYQPKGARLLGVELSEQVLTEIGYFID